jgi:hypothetical protein
MSSAAGALRRMAQAGARQISTSAPKMAGHGNEPVRGARLLPLALRSVAQFWRLCACACACAVARALSPRAAVQQLDAEQPCCTRRQQHAQRRATWRLCARPYLLSLAQP